jgi:hypothetical protein
MYSIVSPAWLTAFLVASASWHQDVQGHAPPAPAVKLAVAEVHLPMSFRGGRPVIEGKISGKGPYRFYLDTGASGPVLSQALASELGLKIIGSVGIKSGGDAADKKPIAGKLVNIDLLELGQVRLTDVTIAAMDRSRLGGKDAPSGVLSPAMFPGYLVTLDYPKKEVRIRAGALPPPDDKTIFAYQQGEPIPSLQTRIGDYQIVTHLDSGSGAGLSLPTRIAEKLPLDGKPRDTGKRARSVRGDFPVFEARLKGSLQFGQYKIDDLTIQFSDVVKGGNIGAGILDRFAVTLDVKNRRFQMTRTE